MKSRIHNLFTLLLAFEMLVSSFGIAQVSHVCKMALSGVTTEYREVENPSHPCCAKTDEGLCSTESTEPCCSTQVKYFHNEIFSTTQEHASNKIIQVCEIDLLPHFNYSEPVAAAVQYTDNYTPGNFVKAPCNKFITFLSLLI